MATRVNITQIANFDIHDERIWLSNGKNGKKVLNFTWVSVVWTMIHRCAHYYFAVLGQIERTFLSIYKTCKAAVDAVNNHFEPTKENVVFERHVFHEAMQGTNESSLTFV